MLVLPKEAGSKGKGGGGCLALLLMNIDEFKKLDCCLPLHNENFRKPSPNEVKILRSFLGLSQNQVGRYLGKNVTPKGCSAVRKWESGTNSSNYRAIELNAWRRLLYLIGVGNPNEDLNDALNNG